MRMTKILNRNILKCSALTMSFLFGATMFSAQELEKRGANNKCGYVLKGSKSGLLGPKFVIKDNFTCSSKEFDETGLAVVQSVSNNKWGVINKKGEIVIPTEYQEGTSMSNGKIVAKKDGKWGLIDTEGKILLPFVYDYLNAESTDKTKILLARKGDNPKQYGFIDFSGKILVPIEYDEVRFVPMSVSNGSRHYNLKKDGKYGLYGLDEGKLLTEVKYDNPLHFTSTKLPLVYKGTMDGDEYEISETGVEKYLGAGKPKNNSLSSTSSASSTTKKTDSKKDAPEKSYTFKCVRCNHTETKTGSGSPAGGKCSAHVRSSGSSTSHTWKKL